MTTIDRYGVTWPDGTETCPVCGQPDNVGDCDHAPLTTEEVRTLGGSR